MCHDLEQYQQLVSFLSETLGNTFEAGLFDLTDPAYPLIAPANTCGDVQDRVRSMLIQVIDSGNLQGVSYLANRPIQINMEKLLKVSIYFIRDEAGQLLGALWLSMRCDLFLKMDAFATSFLRFSTEGLDQDGMEPVIRDAEPVRELSLDTIAQVIGEFSVAPARMTLEERQEVICDLYDAGVFNLKGAVARAAEELLISEQSVYRYIAKIKKARDW